MTQKRYDFPPRRYWGSLREVWMYAEAVRNVDPKGAQGVPISGDDLARLKAAHRA